MARSSAKTKYKAIVNGAVELIWIQSLVDELSIILLGSPTLWCNDIGGTYVAANPIFHA